MLGTGDWGLGNGEWGMGTGDWGLGTGDWGLGNGDWGLGTGDWGLGTGEMGRWGDGEMGGQLRTQDSGLRTQDSALTTDQMKVKTMATWQCVKQCGACCNLEPADRPEIEEYLSPEELELYLSMVGEGGWCVNFDHTTRECRIYANRPRFCRVQPDIFEEMYGIEPEDLNDFAIDCCRQQIEGVYGDRSLEMLRFDKAVGI